MSKDYPIARVMVANAVLFAEFTKFGPHTQIFFVCRYSYHLRWGYGWRLTFLVKCYTKYKKFVWEFLINNYTLYESSSIKLIKSLVAYQFSHTWFSFPIRSYGN